MDSIKDLLADPLKGTKQAQGVLCYLFREVLLWRKINWFTWNRRQKAYFEKPHNAVNPDKGNLNKALKADDMNWPGFKKGIDFLNPESATLEVKLNWTHKESTSYVIVIDPTEDEKNPTVNNFPWQDCPIFKSAKPAETLMSHLFRHIVAEEGKGEPDIMVWWEKKFDDYIKNPVNVVGLNQKEINQNIAALRRSLMEARMSWNVFRRGLHLLRPRSEEYILTLHWTTDPEMKKTLPDSIHPIKIADPYFVE
ncbi:hypothetical protein AVT69_gp198 [Pseudomonas phage PhiPA3]|uniref:Uncharacterized protein 200 n=1 Tax=Pseudomonas phage PhiPA3 TaxID=998086 RepID=F8SJ43_BPPA3|nr:hypothetical protein AVT69_gp198 [Pseudomonas phage PhiPA3]AEH03623.1 hypothetical protein [Pseudomonas phage PhiPA3]